MASSQQVSLSQVKKIELGSIVIPDEFAGKHSAIKRLILLNPIEADLDNPTVAAARAFLAADAVHTNQPTLESDAPEVAATEVATPEALDATAAEAI